nr:cation transporting ATPase C-terminal domain-containing protein [Rhodocyclus gracilis]
MCAAYGRFHGDLLCALYAHAWSESRIFPHVEWSPLLNSRITGAALARGIATEEARAMAFLALATANAVLIFASRPLPPGWQGMFTGLSPLAVWVLVGTLAAVAAITTVPPAAAAFGFAPPSLANWLISAAAGAASLVLFIAAKVAVVSRKK